jgi:hypothetical protein
MARETARGRPSGTDTITMATPVVNALKIDYMVSFDSN